MATLLRKLRSLQRLDGADRRRALRAVVTLWKVSRMLRKVGLQRCRTRLLERLRNVPVASPPNSEDLIVAWDWAVRLASRNVPVRARCLEQSITLWYLLALDGVASDLRIGVRKSRPDAVEAHAWVEVDGHPINDRADIAQTYAVFDGPLPATAQVR